MVPMSLFSLEGKTALVTGGKRWQLSMGRSSSIRMRSLDQIQVGPHPESVVPTGLSALGAPRNRCPNGYRGQTSGQTRKHLPSMQPSMARGRRLPALLTADGRELSAALVGTEVGLRRRDTTGVPSDAIDNTRVVDQFLGS
jgi:hypothetical protein